MLVRCVIRCTHVAVCRSILCIVCLQKACTLCCRCRQSRGCCLGLRAAMLRSLYLFFFPFSSSFWSSSWRMRFFSIMGAKWALVASATVIFKTLQYTIVFWYSPSTLNLRRTVFELGAVFWIVLSFVFSAGIWKTGFFAWNFAFSVQIKSSQAHVGCRELQICVVYTILHILLP